MTDDASQSPSDLTLTITVTDENDQAPVYDAADTDDTFSIEEGSGTSSFDDGSITDSDTVSYTHLTLPTILLV